MEMDRVAKEEKMGTYVGKKESILIGCEQNTGTCDCFCSPVCTSWLHKALLFWHESHGFGAYVV